MRWWVVAAGVLALASCSDGGGETAVAEAGTAAPAASDSAPSPTVTAASAPATEPPVTSAPTTTTSTTIAPTTTIDPAVELAEQVEADFREGWRLLRIAQQNPNDTRAADAALSYVGGSSRRAVGRSLQDLRNGGLRILPDPPLPARIDIEDKPKMQTDGAVAVQACVIDPWVLVETGAGPGGSDAIVDDNVYAYRNRVTLEKIEGLWKVTESVEVGRWVGEASCGPS